jgi:hypothetical protein
MRGDVKKISSGVRKLDAQMFTPRSSYTRFQLKRKAPHEATPEYEIA